MKLLPKLWLKRRVNYPRLLVAFFLFTVGVLLYANLDRDALFDWDEGIYGELGRQLTLRGNLLTSYWNGEPWFEKPPGITWVSALGISLAGPTALGARLLMPLFAVYTLYMVYRLGRRLGNWRHGLLAAGILATLNLFLGRTRAINTDMPLLAGITTTLVFLLENRPAWWVALAVAVSVWFKGPAGLLSILIALPLLFTQTQKYWLLFIGYCLLFILPWHLYSYLKYGADFVTPYFSEQLLRRATAQIEFHFEPRWYYFSYLSENLGLGVLLVVAIGALIAFRQIWSRTPLRALAITLLWWLFIPLGIFTVAKTRLFWYILPIYPALALLITLALTHWLRAKSSRPVLTLLTLGVLLQAVLSTSRSVELSKTRAPLPDRLVVAAQLAQIDHSELIVLVPPSERLAEALLPAVARLGSSFRYGGMPSVVFYYHGPVKFFYNVDTFQEYFTSHSSPALIHVDDQSHFSGAYTVLSITPSYLGIGKAVYAQR